MEILTARQVSKQYRMGAVTVNALEGVDFRVARREFVAVMGPSGSGKSTLLHLLGGLDGPTDGEVTIAGHPLSQLNDREVTLVRRHNVGFIFQFFNLLPTLTAEENITLPLLIDNRNLHEYRDQIDGLLELVGLTDRRHHRPDQLSGGQQQRVAIARAFITNPAIVLADEPTGNLDSKTGDEILRLLRRSCDELGQTIVMVTHDAKAASFADRVVFLRDGRVVGDLKTTGNQIDDIRTIQRRLRELEA
jgi:putative ABC transport system ATP-binding protein